MGVEVTMEKRERIKQMAKDLLDKQVVVVREMAAFTGLVISCAPAGGRSARFYTRVSVSWCRAWWTGPTGGPRESCTER